MHGGAQVYTTNIQRNAKYPRDDTSHSSVSCRMRRSGWVERVLLHHRLSDGSTRSLALVVTFLALGCLITIQFAALQAVGLRLVGHCLASG